MNEIQKLTYLCCAVIITSLLFTQSYITCLPEIARYFSVPDHVIQIIFMSNLLLFGVSQLFYGPLSDKAGRVYCLKLGLGITLIGSLISAFAPILSIFFIGQCLTGIGSGACSVLPRAILKDNLTSVSLIRAIALLSMSTTAATGLAPLAGSAISTNLGWRGVFFMLSLIALVIWYITAKQLANNTKENPSSVVSENIVKDYLLIFSNKTFLCYSILNWCGYVSIIIYLLITPFIFQGQFHLTIMQNSYIYAACALCYLIANFTLNRLITVDNTLRFISIGLVAITLGSLAVIISLPMNSKSELALIMAGMLINAGSGLITPITFKMALSIHQFSTGISSAAISASRIIISFLLSSLITTMFASTASTLAYFIVVISVLAYSTFYLMKLLERNLRIQT